MTLTSNQNNIDQDSSTINMTACTSFNSPHNIELPLNVPYKIELDYTYRHGYDRKQQIYTSSHTVTVYKGEYCDNITINITDDLMCHNLLEVTVFSASSLINDRKSSNPIWVRHSTEGSDNFNKYLPILKILPLKEWQNISISIVDDCGYDGICSAFLYLNCTFKNVGENGSYITINSSETFQLLIDVMNKGPEPSYCTKATINISKPLFMDDTEKCKNTYNKEAWTLITCSIKNRLRTDESDSVTLDLKVEGDFDVVENVSLSVMVETESVNDDIGGNKKVFNIQIIGSKFSFRTEYIIAIAVVVGVLLLILLIAGAWKVRQSCHRTDLNCERQKRSDLGDTMYDDVGNVTQSCHHTDLAYEGQKRSDLEDTVYDDVGNSIFGETGSSYVTTSQAGIATFHISRHGQSIQDHNPYEFTENDEQYIYFESSTTVKDGEKHEEADNNEYEDL